MKPFASSARLPRSHSVLGSAPVIINTCSMSRVSLAPVLVLRKRTLLRCVSPSRASILVQAMSVIRGLASIRDIKYRDMVLASAVEVLIAEGININITLMFSLAHYEAVAQAYLRGLKRNAKPHQVSSVASFFVSRVDTEVDRALQTIGTPEALSRRGKIAIANARVVYRRFREIFLGTPFEEFRRRGARLQRPLWASTGTKNPAFSDVLYVEELIGPHTINTIPPATLNAFRDHGRVQPTLEAGEQDAEQALARLARLGIDLAAITEKLLADGITAFTHSLDELLASLMEK